MTQAEITFESLNLAKPLLRALESEGYAQPTPIQAQAIPPVLAGKDLLGIAQTGTGKTAAFALPILQRLDADRRPAPRRGCRCLVLSPTRELASQIAESFRAYGRHMNMTVAVIFGGVKINPQIKALERGIDVLVATPGRLLDHLGQHTAYLGETEIFVLDEADQMLDLGFIVPIRRIVNNFKKPRQNLFFSATMPTEIGKLAGELLKDPVKVSVTPQATTVERVNQSLIFVEADKKRELLAELFEDPNYTRTLVFTRTKRGADRVAKHLVACGVNAASIHGDKSQPQREKALAQFKAGSVRALVATDIAARGIDVEAVSHVVQFELPNVPEAYVHRIGRTARAGASGSAVAFCADDERPLLKDIQKVTRQVIPSDDRRRDPQLAVLAKATRAQEAAEPKSDYNPSENHAARPNNERGGRDGPRRQPHRSRGDGAGRPQGEAARGNAPRGDAPGQGQPRQGQGNGGGGRSGQPQRNGQPQRYGEARNGQNRPAHARSDARPAHDGGQASPKRHEGGGRNRPAAAAASGGEPRGDRWDPANS